MLVYAVYAMALMPKIVMAATDVRSVVVAFAGSCYSPMVHSVEVAMRVKVNGRY